MIFFEKYGREYLNISRSLFNVLFLPLWYAIAMDMQCYAFFKSAWK